MFRKRSGPEENVPLYGIRDERTKAVIYQGDAYTGRFMLFAILADVCIRGIKLFDPITSSNFDLLFIVLAGSAISIIYQVKTKVMFNKPYLRNILYAVMILAVSALTALVCVTLFGR